MFDSLELAQRVAARPGDVSASVHLVSTPRFVQRQTRRDGLSTAVVRLDDVERIWPFGFQHIDMLHYYLSNQLTRGELLESGAGGADELGLT